MPALDLLDTNILVYAYDAGDPRKQHIAQDLVRQALAGDIVASSQVLAEFAATLLHKLSPAARPAKVTAILDILAPVKLVSIDGDTVRRAIEARARYRDPLLRRNDYRRSRAWRLHADLVRGLELGTKLFWGQCRKPVSLILIPSVQRFFTSPAVPLSRNTPPNTRHPAHGFFDLASFTLPNHS